MGDARPVYLSQHPCIPAKRALPCGLPEGKEVHMNDAPKHEAHEAAAAIIAEYGTPKSPESLQAMLAFAYAQGSRAGFEEGVAAKADE